MAPRVSNRPSPPTESRAARDEGRRQTSRQFHLSFQKSARRQRPVTKTDSEGLSRKVDSIAPLGYVLDLFPLINPVDEF